MVSPSDRLEANKKTEGWVCTQELSFNVEKVQ